MKKSLLCTLLLTLFLSFASQAQDFSRLETLSKKIKYQAEELIKLTSKDIKSDEMNSRKEIENAFLAEQLYASVKLIRQMFHNKRRASELRYAGSMLMKLANRFPRTGSNSFEWKKTEDLVGELSRELRGIGGSINSRKKYEINESEIIGRAFWNGIVDADVQLLVRKTRLFTKTLDGKSYPDGIYSFSSSLPKRSRIRVGVKIKKGRGKVHVIQQPDRTNNFTAIIEIRDNEGGAKPYSIEIYWYRR